MRKTPLQYALDMITLRDRSEFEIRKKMTEKEYTAEEIASTVQWLKDKKFLDDERFVEHYVKYQLSIGRNGKQKIKLKLYQLGVNEELVHKYLSGNDDSEFENALCQAEKWLKRNTIEDKYKQKEKLCRFLMGRGFGYDVFRNIAEKLNKN